MWNKFNKIFQAISPYLEEGIVLLYPNQELEVLTDATYKFLKTDKKEKIFLSDLDSNPIVEKIRVMLEKNTSQSVINFLEKNVSINIEAFGKPGRVLIILKDMTNHEKILHMGKEFVGNASHELRTPITIIKGFTEMLLESKEIEESIQQSILKKMSTSCNRMEHLVKHLLRITDLEHCDLDAKSSVDIHRIIEDVSYQVISIYPDVRIEHLRKEGEMRAWIDSNLIELVLTNLFKNSVKYSRTEKVIEVKVDTVEEYVYICIQDRGIGIPEKDLEKIFDRFYTVNKAHCRKLGGAGLGLSIVRLIVEKHGGKIYATSELGLSTTMHLYLPKAKESKEVGLK